MSTWLSRFRYRGSLAPFYQPILFFMLLLLTLLSAFGVLHTTQSTRMKLDKKECLRGEYDALLEERDNLYLEKEVLSDSVRIEVLATYELNMRPMQPSDNAMYLIQ